MPGTCSERWVYFVARTDRGEEFDFRMRPGSCCRNSRVKIYLAEIRAKQVIKERSLDGELKPYSTKESQKSVQKRLF